MHAQVADVRVDERTGRLRQEHLPAVADGGDPRALVHVEADVSLLGQPRLARVQPHPHAYRPVGQRALAVRGSGDRVRRAGEGDEERVTLRVDLDALVVGKRRAESPPMLVQRLPVPVAELVQQPRRPLHVREQQRHDAGREIAHHRARSWSDAASLSTGRSNSCGPEATLGALRIEEVRQAPTTQPGLEGSNVVPSGPFRESDRRPECVATSTTTALVRDDRIKGRLPRPSKRSSVTLGGVHDKGVGSARFGLSVSTSLGVSAALCLCVAVAAPARSASSPRASPARVGAATATAATNGMIAYTLRLHGALPDIWVMNADGSGAQLLHSAGSSPAWSPDGNQVAFVDIAGNVQVMNADGTGVRALTSVGGGGSPVWSPDGKQIAYIRTTAIRMVDLASGANAELFDSQCQMYHIAWATTPRGPRIAYAGCAPGKSACSTCSTLARPQRSRAGGAGSIR